MVHIVTFVTLALIFGGSIGLIISMIRGSGDKILAALAGTPKQPIATPLPRRAIRPVRRVARTQGYPLRAAA